MNKLAIALLPTSSAAASFSRASATKHEFLKKLKSHEPVTPATTPEASSDKKGGH